jgi:flavin-dependent dehydrogenase
VVVGDAAGLLDPLTGEEIYAAIASGITAARHLAGYADGQISALGGYQRELERGLLAELRVAIQMRDLFHLAPWLWAKLLNRSDRIWNVVCRLLTGDQTYFDIKRRFPGLDVAVDVGSDAIRTISHRLAIGAAGEIPLAERCFRCGLMRQAVAGLRA